jgi:hypothetical protein
MTRFSS